MVATVFELCSFTNGYFHFSFNPIQRKVTTETTATKLQCNPDLTIESISSVLKLCLISVWPPKGLKVQYIQLKIKCFIKEETQGKNKDKNARIHTETAFSYDPPSCWHVPFYGSFLDRSSRICQSNLSSKPKISSRHMIEKSKYLNQVEWFYFS